MFSLFHRHIGKKICAPRCRPHHVFALLACRSLWSACGCPGAHCTAEDSALLGGNAIDAGRRKEQHNMSFLGATSRTVCARTSAWCSVGIARELASRQGSSQRKEFQSDTAISLLCAMLRISREWPHCAPAPRWRQMEDNEGAGIHERCSSIINDERCSSRMSDARQ